MAKRRRLSPAVLTAGPVAEPSAARPPISQAAGDAAEHAAFAEVTQALTKARQEGRLIQKLPLAEIETGHLVRDRVAFDPDEMAALQDSLQRRGQQVPIEVVLHEEGGYGLISGLRRVMALRANGAKEVLALVRQPDSSAEAYLAMVEENEIRAGISFYERARLAAEAAKLGIYDSPAAAIAALFASASPAKRSKIGSFVRVHDVLGEVLRFPAAIPERLGLALAGALEQTGFAATLCRQLEAADCVDPGAERAVLEAALKGQGAGQKTGSTAPGRAEKRELRPGLCLDVRSGRVVLSGQAVTPQLAQALEDWLRDQA